jgi:hypothetical protein
VVKIIFEIADGIGIKCNSNEINPNNNIKANYFKKQGFSSSFLLRYLK